jgi:enoyl-CoA hydratase
MIKTESIYLVKEGSIATIYLNRPDKRNAMNYEMWSKLPELLEEAESNPSIKALILRGVNDVAFSAGADISEFKEVRSNGKQSRLYDQTTHRANECLANFKKPSIALIQGYCVGGGAGLALDCDFRFSDTNGRFGITPSKLGLVYGTSSTKRIVDLVGPAKAKDILMSGRIMNVEEAYRIGLIDCILQPDEIEEKTYEYANLIASRAQFTVRAAKQIVKEVLNGAMKNSDEINRLVEEAYDTEDYKEGVRAFMEKRKPDFKYS